MATTSTECFLLRANKMQICWKASFSASCLHAAVCMQEGLPIADTQVAAVLHPAVEALIVELIECGIAVESLLPLLVELAADYENNRQLVESAVRRAWGADALGEAAVSRLAGCVADLESAWLRHQPKLVEELALRGRPLREQWEACGPGLLRVAERLTFEGLIAASAEVVLVSPSVGGHGRAHLLTNRVTFEAVLAHPQPELPETLRLGWLLLQLNLDVPMFSEPISRNRLPRLASLATLPLVLRAAAELELAQLDEATLSRAIEVWHLAPLPAGSAATLLNWWHTYEASNVRWPTAMAALDHMLSESG